MITSASPKCVKFPLSICDTRRNTALRTLRRHKQQHLVLPHFHLSVRASSTQSQQTADVLIVGTGIAGLSAGLRCHHHNLKPLIIEKSTKVGGTSAWSGGGLWIPNNSLHKPRGIMDSPEKALQYLDVLIGDVGPASTPARRQAYVNNGSKMIDYLSEIGMKWIPTPGLPDYHSDLPGALEDGRTVEAGLFDLKKLGRWRRSLNPPSMFAGPPMHIFEGIQASQAASSVQGFMTLTKIVLRWLGLRLLGRDPAALGQSMIGQMLKLNVDKGSEIWTDAGLQRLTVDETGRVTGAIIKKDGRDIGISARKGVILCAGGFAKNATLREKYQQSPTNPAWSSATPHDTGEALQAGIDVGGATALMKEAWWGPTFIDPASGRPYFSMGERGRPHSIIVDSAGNRFMNEAQSYNDTGHAQYARHKTTPAIPAWMIMDSQYTKANPMVMIGPRYSLKKGLKAGFFVQGDTVEELCKRIGVDALGLQRTIERFNGFAKQGRDEDYHRGETAMDRMGGDPAIKPNSSLGSIEKGPFLAMRVYPGDLGTKGGLLTDEHGQVIHTQGHQIAGLFASGNTTASVMGRRYAGAGATLGPGMVFACLAVDRMSGHS